MAATVSPDLGHVYDEISIPEKEREVLMKKYRISRYDELKSKKQCLLRGELSGITNETQETLAAVLDYIESTGSSSSDSLVNFSRGSFMLYHVGLQVQDRDIDFSAAKERRATDATRKRKNSSEHPICIDLSDDDAEERESCSKMSAGQSRTSVVSDVMENFLLENFLPEEDEILESLGSVEGESTPSGCTEMGSVEGETTRSECTEMGAIEFRREERAEEIERQFVTAESKEDGIEDKLEREISDTEGDNYFTENGIPGPNKFEMMVQGFLKSKTWPNVEQDINSLSPLDGSDRESSLSDKRPYVDFEGRRYFTRRCFEYKNPQGGLLSASNECVMVGIVSFHSSSPEAKCVLVVPTSDTCLGTEDTENEFSRAISPVEFVQVRMNLDPLPLSNFGQEITSPTGIPMSIPKLIYEPQLPGSRQTFGYVYDNKSVNRVGERREKRFIDLFCGSGGAHLGYVKEGFFCAKAVEIENTAVETFTHNHASSVYVGDCNKFLEKCDNDQEYRKTIGPIHLIICSSPCQGYSSANRNGGKDDEANNKLSLTFPDAMRIFGPDVGVFENVEGMWRRKHLPFLKRILILVMSYGYQIRCFVIRACDYGDPQHRPRLIILAVKQHIPMPPPLKPTHGDGPDLIPFVTVKDVLEGLRRNADSEKDAPNRGSKFTSLSAGEHGVVRLDANGLAPTIKATGTPPLHYAEDRCITVREAAALQSFPQHYVFIGSIAEQYKQIGNAISGNLATALARWAGSVLRFEYENKSEEE